MVINYQKFPILKALEQTSFNEKCEILATLDLQEDKMAFLTPVVSIVKHWGEIAADVRDNITFVSKPYLDCMKRSWKSFSKIDLRESITNTSGCLIFQAELSNEYVALIYSVDTIGKMMIIGLNECDTLYMFMKGSYDNPHMVVTYDEGVLAGSSREEAGLAFMNILICYLLMEKYAKVETITCTGNQKIKNVDSASDKKTINYTNLNLKFRDCTWFTTICRNEGFKVRGHFRLQPKKDESGEWTKELIYINEFEKHGYHRIAKIEKNE